MPGWDIFGVTVHLECNLSKLRITFVWVILYSFCRLATYIVIQHTCHILIHVGYQGMGDGQSFDFCWLLQNQNLTAVCPSDIIFIAWAQKGYMILLLVAIVIFAIKDTCSVCNFVHCTMHWHCAVKEALSVLMLCAPVFIFTSSSSALSGRPRCGLLIWLSLLATFSTLFWVYAVYFVLFFYFFQKKTDKTWKYLKSYETDSY